ncbi:MAG TPA: acetyl-CoA decarbonylase/synthase complex subunit gamma, partial [Caldilineae bacterium]|nr:acetyl-CoA decarbonylase/synthase complex subunit gamma [Caldilineae bacterium]
MALTGLQIYKLLPKTNCKECGFPTCLAFAMKLAAKQAELSACPYVSEEAKAQLEEASAPPIRLITLSSDGYKVEAGNETVLFRHEKTFYHKPGLFVRVRDDLPSDEIQSLVQQVHDYAVEYVGISLTLDGVAVEAASGDPATYAAAVKQATQAERPLILLAPDPKMAEAGLDAATDVRPLLWCATADNWQSLAELAKAHNVPLAVRGDGDLSALAGLTEQIKAAGVEDLVLDPGPRDPLDTLMTFTQIRRLALQKNLRALGYPIIAFPGEGVEDPGDEPLLAAQHIAKYAGFIVLDRFTPASAYGLLVWRENIFTDPQKPIQVEPGIYEINNPGPEDPVMVTTNFSITYFAVANEVESSGHPGWLLVADAEGMSVLTAWAAGKFDAEKIAKTVKGTGIESKVKHRKVIIPGHVAVLLGELEEELPDWQVLVGPREAVDLP